MKSLVRTAGLLAVPAIMAMGVPAHADSWDKMTKITVNASIEVPGAVLPAGTYVLKLLNSPSNRHIVQVLNERQSHVYATVFAIPNERRDRSGNTVLTFYEVAAGQPQPVRAWFYPGDSFGQEFVYSKARLQELSKSVTTTTPYVAPPAEPQQTVAALEPEPTPAPAPEPVVETPAPAPVIIAQNEPPASPASTPTTPVMPQTGSNIPLFALIGFLSIGSALGLGSFVKRLT